MKIGSLFSGYGGLDMGVRLAIGGTVAWHCDNDPGAAKILAHHWPDVPNLGNITAVDWTQVEPVDVITGGSPCQDVSHAGKRQGMRAGTRSGLWASMCDAIETIRPALVVWENVRGAYSAAADSGVEPCPICVGDAGKPDLRALGRVLGDLAELGYDARWVGLRAADVGAPHGRFRVFVIAWPSDAERGGWERRRAQGIGGSSDAATWCSARVATDSASDGRHQGRPEPARLIRGSDAAERGHGPAADARGQRCDGRPSDLGTRRAPAIGSEAIDHARHEADSLVTHTDDRADHGQRACAQPRGGSDAAADASGERHGRGQDGRALGRLDGDDAGEARQRERAREVARDRGAEAAADADCQRLQRIGRLVPLGRDADGCRGADIAWGIYEPAVRRWERLTRPAPAPTSPGSKGQPRLSAHFVEWLMGLPAGHVTDVPGLSRNDQLKALGNGVVPQQAAAAVRMTLQPPTVKRATLDA